MPAGVDNGSPAKIYADNYRQKYNEVNCEICKQIVLTDELKAKMRSLGLITIENDQEVMKVFLSSIIISL